jgi:hypothetical protein
VGIISTDDDGNTGGSPLADGTRAVVDSLGMVPEIVADTVVGVLEPGIDVSFEGTTGKISVVVDEGSTLELLGLLDNPGTTGGILVSVSDVTGDGG